VRGSAGAESLDTTFRGDAPWPEDRKRALIKRGYDLTDEALQDSDDLGLYERSGVHGERL
jgi:hypothetical protein